MLYGSGSSGDSGTEGESDSDEESDSEEGSEGKGNKRRKKLSLDERRAEQAAGDHPLQQRFQELAGQLLHKHTGGKEGRHLLSIQSRELHPVHTDASSALTLVGKTYHFGFKARYSWPAPFKIRN